MLCVEWRELHSTHLKVSDSSYSISWHQSITLSMHIFIFIFYLYLFYPSTSSPSPSTYLLSLSLKPLVYLDKSLLLRCRTKSSTLFIIAPASDTTHNVPIVPFTYPYLLFNSNTLSFLHIHTYTVRTSFQGL